MRACLLLGLTLLCSSIIHGQEHWPAFRGGTLSGVGKGDDFPTDWSKDKNITWKMTIPGRGWSSPIVWGDRVFLTSTVSEGKDREPRKGLYVANVFGKVDPGTHHWYVHCLDRKTGKKLWSKEAHKGVVKGKIHIKNSYASETPVTDGERIYAYFGNVGLYCYDMTGKKLWDKSFKPVSTRFGWGTASSPVLHDGRLYIVNDNDTGSYLLTLNAKTGKEIWKVERDEKSNWATPYVWENSKRTEIITPGTRKIRSYDLDGKLLWELGGMSSITIPTPIEAHGLLYVTSGYVLDFKKPLYAIRPGASGDISLKEGQKQSEYIAWVQKSAGPYHPSPVVYGGYLYMLYDRGNLSCFDAKTGKPMYLKQSIARAPFTASPWAADGKIYCLDENGITHVVQAGPKFKVLGKNTLNGEMTLATPAITQGSFFIRTLNTLYRIGKK